MVLLELLFFVWHLVHYCLLARHSLHNKIKQDLSYIHMATSNSLKVFEYRKMNRDLVWLYFLANKVADSNVPATCVPLRASEMLYPLQNFILYNSGYPYSKMCVYI